MSYSGGQDRRALELRLRDLLQRIARLEKLGVTGKSGDGGGSGSVITRIQSAAIGELDAHKTAADPHPQYLTPVEGNAAYEAAGAVVAHEAKLDPHPQYANASLDDTDIDGGIAASHYLGLLADGGSTYNKPLTEGVIDGGSA